MSNSFLPFSHLHKTDKKQYNKLYYQLTKEKQLEDYHKRRQNPEWVNQKIEYDRQYKKGHPELREYNHIYQQNHKLEMSMQSREYNLKRKNRVLIHYGNGECACIQCGESRIACLSIDHINGGGNKHRKAIGEDSRFYAWLENNNYPEGYQTLCMNCQWIKKFEKGELGNYAIPTNY